MAIVQNRKNNNKTTRTPAQRAEHAKLVNAVKSQVGGSWDELFQALCNEYSGLTKTQVLDKLQAVIGYNTSFKDGQVRIHNAKGVISLDNAAVFYYVEPTTKVIAENPFPKKRQEEQRQRAEKEKREQDSRMRKLADNLICLKTGDQWTAVEIAPVESDEKGYYDVILKRRVYQSIWSDLQELQKLYMIKNMYGKECRVLSAREVAHLNLNK